MEASPFCTVNDSLDRYCESNLFAGNDHPGILKQNQEFLFTKKSGIELNTLSFEEEWSTLLLTQPGECIMDSSSYFRLQLLEEEQ